MKINIISKVLVCMFLCSIFSSLLLFGTSVGVEKVQSCQLINVVKGNSNFTNLNQPVNIGSETILDNIDENVVHFTSTSASELLVNFYVGGYNSSVSECTAVNITIRKGDLNDPLLKILVLDINNKAVNYTTGKIEYLLEDQINSTSIQLSFAPSTIRRVQVVATTKLFSSPDFYVDQLLFIYSGEYIPAIDSELLTDSSGYWLLGGIIGFAIICGIIYLIARRKESLR